MTLQTASILLVLSVIGIVLVYRYLRNKPKLRIICLILLSLIALLMAVYIGLIYIFLDAIRHQPPT